MKYYYVNVLVEVPDDEHEQWDASCDETFYMAHVHDPENGFYVTDYHQVVVWPNDVARLKTKIFTEEGGI